MFAVLVYEPNDLIDLDSTETSRALEPNRIKPNLGDSSFAPHVNMRRLGLVQRHEEEPISGDSKNGGHLDILSSHRSRICMYPFSLSQPPVPNPFMAEAIRLAVEGVAAGRGGPFGAVVVKDGQIVGRGCNEVTSANDPTAHAEILAIREACKSIGSFHLTDCELYTSCEPCPMCLSAIYWARIERYYFGCTAKDAAAIQFADDFIRHELSVPPHERTIPAIPLMRTEALAAFAAWQAKAGRVPY